METNLGIRKVLKANAAEKIRELQFFSELGYIDKTSTMFSKALTVLYNLLRSNEIVFLEVLQFRL